MTVTTDPVELRRQAVRQHALGNYAYAASLYAEAIANVPVVLRTSAFATDTAAMAVEVAASHVFAVHGHDGTVLTG